MANYFSYLGLKPAPEELIQRFGRELDKLMTLDMNLTGRPSELYARERGASRQASSTTFAEALLRTLVPNDMVILVTGWPVRPRIDVSIGEADGPAGAAAIARTLYFTRSVRCVVIVPAPLMIQTAAAFQATGAAIISLDSIKRFAEGQETLFGVTIVGLELDRDLSSYFAELFEDLSPKAIIAVEHYGFSANGKAHLATGSPIGPGLAFTHSLFDQGIEKGMLCGSCVDNANEVGTGRLHGYDVKHPPMRNSFANIVVGSSANLAAFAVCAAMSGLTGMPSAAFTGKLDEASVAATLANGAIDPFSGTADPNFGVDTLERPYHGWITDLMARLTQGYCAAAKLDNTP